MFLLSNLLRRFIRSGVLVVIDHRGRSHRFGGNGPGPEVHLRLTDPAIYNKLALNPELHAGEAYMNGTMVFDSGCDIGDLLLLFSLNRSGLKNHPTQRALRRFWRGAKRVHQANPITRAAANARHHYDISTEIYRLFLDDGLNYSCGYFENPDDTLDQAQFNKLGRIVRKLRIQPGMKVCEIGSGWGSLAIELATAGADVTALNVSPEQISVSRQRATLAGVSDRITFFEMDYRNIAGQFDRIVSVGMMEHVGVGHFDEYFHAIKSLLKEDGYALVHCIGRMMPPGSTAPFIRKYIFPGAYVPSLSEVYASTERVALWVADMETLRLHYHYTIREWRRRFAANRDRVKAIADERFCRMWEFYLAAVDVGFMNGSNMVFQILISPRIDAVPIVRELQGVRHERP